MKRGVWFYGVGTALTGVLTIAWSAFDVSHQPFLFLGKNSQGQHMLSYVVGIWLAAAGIAVLLRGSAKLGALASAFAYSIFVLMWLLKCYAGIHTLGWRFNVLAGSAFVVAQQGMLIAPAAIVYVSTASTLSSLQRRVTMAARWMLGLPPIVFGALHLVGIQVFAPIVPHWMPFAYFWAAVTGIAFMLAGIAICSGIRDILAARLLALMLLLFEVLIEIPPIFVRLHNQATWGAAVYNLSAIGACLIFAEILASPVNRGKIGSAKNVNVLRLLCFQ